MEMNSRNLFAELKRRNVYKVAVTYAVVGWVIAQIATQIYDPLFDDLHGDPRFEKIVASLAPKESPAAAK